MRLLRKSCEVFMIYWSKMKASEKIAFSFVVFLALCFRSASGISCYQCLSTDHDNPFQCSEFLTDADIQPQPCDGIYNAQYCVKHTGRFEVISLDCYQCETPFNIGCSDILIHYGYLKPNSCDAIYGASHCIKTTGIFGGGLGTRRFCSPHDLGNYCNYIRQPGDELEYRSCVYTCSTHGCNPATSVKSTLVVIFAPVGLLLLKALVR